MTPDLHAHAIRNELSSLALVVHRLTNDAGGDLTVALATLTEIERLVTATRKSLRELPPVAEVQPPTTERWQRATDYHGTPLWQHACQTALAQQGRGRPDRCHNCDELGEWRPLYAMLARFIDDHQEY